MVLDVEILDVIPHQEKQFECAFDNARNIIASIPGMLHINCKNKIEKEGHYLFLANWGTLEGRTAGFRQSKQYGQWRALLHHFYDPFPEIERSESI